MSEPPLRRRLPLGRQRVLTALVPLCLWLVLELLSGVFLAGIGSEDVQSDVPVEDPEWMVRAKRAFKDRFFRPDDHVLWTLTPNYKRGPGRRGLVGSEDLSLNEHGHRSPPMAKAKPEAVRRVLIVGGSHPFGLWVSTSETYSSVLSEILNEAGPHRWEVMNASSPGHTTFQGRRYLEHYGWEFRPDVVVFDLGMNDELPLSLDFASPDHEVAAVPKWARWVGAKVDRSNVYRLLRTALAEPMGKTGSPATIRVPLENRLQNLTAVRDLGAQKGYQTLFMSQVFVESWKGPGLAGCTFDPSEHGFEPMVDICGLFEQLGPDAGIHFVDRIHGNPAGHRLIAEGVYVRLKELGWLD